MITGVRRCGKSFVMAMIADELRDQGVEPGRIIFLDLDRRPNTAIKTATDLERKIDSLINPGSQNYLFIDEIQNVKGFEEVINAFNNERNISIFLTGSNSYLLSGQIATKLTGRYLQFEIFPLDFAEYLGMKEQYNLERDTLDKEFLVYIRYGGFPKALEFPDMEAKYRYVEGIISEIFTKDIRRNKKIKNKVVFDRLLVYVMNNFGAMVSVNSLFDYFNKVDKTPIAKETIRKYLEILVDAKILYACPLFDCKSKKSLKNKQKYYLADISFYFINNTDARINFGPVLENLVYLHLRQNDFSVSVARIGELECDFIARRNFEEYFYIQVSYLLADRSIEDREYRVFTRIRDNYPKYLLTMDPLLQSRDGILHRNIINFLLSDKELA